MTQSQHWRYRFNLEKKLFEKEENAAFVIEAKNQVLIKPLMVGVCGSDLSKIIHKIDPPSLGHEWVGEVIEVGSAVEHFTNGEIVTSVANTSCGVCKHCKDSNAQHCKRRKLLGAENSVLSSQVMLYDHDLLKVPQDLDLKSITLLEVAYIGDCAFQQAQKVGLTKNSDDKIVIFGAGPIGLMTALSLKERGINSQLIEVMPKRIRAAQELGLTCTPFAQEIIDRQLFGKCDIIFDCTGDASGTGALKLLPVFAKMEAGIIIVGKYHRAILNEADFGGKALRVTWLANHQKSNFEKSISFWEERITKYSAKMIQLYSFRDINKAFDHALQRDVVKAILKFDEIEG